MCTVDTINIANNCGASKRLMPGVAPRAAAVRACCLRQADSQSTCASELYRAGRLKAENGEGKSVLVTSSDKCTCASSVHAV